MVRRNLKTGRGTAKEVRYYAWLEGMPCCLSGRTDGVVRAHTGGWADGKGAGQKAGLWTILPLQNALHLEEERGRTLFWTEALPGEDHLAWADRLHDQFKMDDRAEGERILFEMQELADRRYLAKIFGRVK